MSAVCTGTYTIASCAPTGTKLATRRQRRSTCTRDRSRPRRERSCRSDRRQRLSRTRTRLHRKGPIHRHQRHPGIPSRRAISRARCATARGLRTDPRTTRQRGPDRLMAATSARTMTPCWNHSRPSVSTPLIPASAGDRGQAEARGDHPRGRRGRGGEAGMALRQPVDGHFRGTLVVERVDQPRAFLTSGALALLPLLVRGLRRSACRPPARTLRSQVAREIRIVAADAKCTASRTRSRVGDVTRRERRSRRAGANV